jgi:hypothetical protein
MIAAISCAVHDRPEINVPHSIMSVAQTVFELSRHYLPTLGCYSRASMSWNKIRYLIAE